MPVVPSISENTTLRSLCIVVRYELFWALTILAQVKMTSLEEITLQLHWVEDGRLEDLKWVDNVLSREHFSGLCKVVIRICGAKNHTEVKREARHRMKRVDEKGLLVMQ